MPTRIDEIKELLKQHEQGLIADHELAQMLFGIGMLIHEECKCGLDHTIFTK